MRKPKNTRYPELRQWLEETGQRQYDLARVLGITEGQVSRYLNGHVDIPADAAVRLSLLTKIAPELLVSNPETARILKFLGKGPRLIGRTANESDQIA